MRRTFSLLIFLCLMVLQSVRAQEVAIDFTRTDCDNVEHHLYSDLEAGKVVILDYIMLGCAPCLWATRNLDTLLQSYAVSHPERVKIYAFSYESSYTCKQMKEWRTTGGFPNVTLFTDGAEQVTYYGGMGMPTIVIAGGADHKVFYNGYGYTPLHDSLIIEAIDSALNYSPSGVESMIGPEQLHVFPTVFTDHFNYFIDDDDVGGRLMLLDYSGRMMLETDLKSPGLHRISTGHLCKGLYLLVFRGENSRVGTAKLVRQ